MSQLGEFLSGLVDQHKQITNAGKSADYFVKANPAALDEMGIPQEQWVNLGARDKAMAVNGYVQGKTQQRLGQEAQAQEQLRQAQSAKAQSDADAAQGMPDFAKYLNEEMTPGAPGQTSTGNQPMPGGQGAPVWPPPGQQDWNALLQGNGPVQTPGTSTATAQPGAPVPMGQAVLRALARVQSMNPRLAAAIANKVLPGMLQNATDNDGVQFTQDPVSGKRFATHGKVLAESGMDPSVAQNALSGGAVPISTPDGDLQGYNIPIGQGKYKFQATKDLTAAQKQNLILQHQKAKSDLLGRLDSVLKIGGSGNTNIVNDINDELGQHNDAIQTLKGGTGGPPPPPSGARVTVSDQNGKRFTVPAERLSDAIKQGFTQVK